MPNACGKRLKTGKTVRFWLKPDILAAYRHFLSVARNYLIIISYAN
jgi:hypothetical protein